MWTETAASGKSHFSWLQSVHNIWTAKFCSVMRYLLCKSNWIKYRWQLLPKINCNSKVFITVTVTVIKIHASMLEPLITTWVQHATPACTRSSSSSVEALCPTQHTIGHFGDDFYRPDDKTNSAKALKETSWSSKIRLESHQNHSTMLQ